MGPLFHRFIHANCAKLASAVNGAKLAATVAIAASYAANGFGQTGTPARDARRLCPASSRSRPIIIGSTRVITSGSSCPPGCRSGRSYQPLLKRLPERANTTLECVLPHWPNIHCSGDVKRGSRLAHGACLAEQFHTPQWPNNAMALSRKEWLWSPNRAGVGSPAATLAPE